MGERRTLYRQCDLERAIRAAKATGAGQVIVRLDGSIAIEAEPLDDTTRRRGRAIKALDAVTPSCV